jgi:2,4-dienoyl-CoA reductase-like NADH-dependent reductase (Old Yellow Enzyme family)
MDVTPLFTPLQIKGKLLRNRIVMPPMVVMRGDATPEAAVWYGRHAQGGVGLVIVEATNTALLGRELTVRNLSVLASAIHAGGALAAIQLFPGRRGQSLAPADLDPEQIDDLVAQYDLAARLCLAAGFDGIEPHGAHGYLLNQFFSPEENTRTDAYGGDMPGRMHLALRIVQAVRPICDEGMLLLYRHTPVGPGYGIAESLVLARALVESGVDILDLSPSSIDAPGDRAAPFKPLGIPVIAVNGLDEVSRALEVLNNRRADLIAIGRGLIADPDWPIKVRENRQGEIVVCIQCDACHGDLSAGRAVACTQWS